MELLTLNDPATKDMMSTMLQKRNLVPVLGAGFSKGQQSYRATVPDAATFRSVMLQTIKEHAADNDISSIADKNFHEVAEYFMNKDFVPLDVRKIVIRNYFTDVSLSINLVNFLKCNWPYVYTLNIDDAIESNSKFSYTILPYRNISSSAREFDCVYKIHGDAKYEIAYEESSSIIFSTDSYVQSLTTNQSMLTALRTDLVEQNTLFLGCSLDGEIDLLYSLTSYRGTFPTGRKSIYVSSFEPDRYFKAKLAKHGINSIFLIQDYDGFYKWFASISFESGRSISHIAPYSIARIEYPLKNDRRANIDFLLRSPTSRVQQTSTVLPDFYIERDIARPIDVALNRESVVLVRGRRFSGRSLLLRGLARSSTSRNVYLFGSDVSVTTEIIDDLRMVRNGLFLFDTNSLSARTAGLVASSLEHFRSNGSRAVIAVNRTEFDVTGIFAKIISDEEDFELEGRLGRDELRRLNDKLDKLGMFRFQPSKTILNNTFSMLSRYDEHTSVLLEINTLLPGEEDILLIVAVMDKCFTNLASVFDVRGDGVFAFATKMAPLIDVADTSQTEMKDSNSRHKLVHNSQIGIRLAVREVVARDRTKNVSDRLFGIASRLLGIPQFQAVGRKIVMFDAVNDLLTDISGNEMNMGYRPTVLDLYQKLQAIMYGAPDYWLQRAKAILYLEADPRALIEGIGYAKKALAEATRERTADNAEFTVALLYGKLCNVTAYKDTQQVIEAIECFVRAIGNYSNNAHYVRNLIIGRASKKNSFERLCDYLRGPIGDVELLVKKHDIAYLLAAQKNYSGSWRG